MKKFTKFDLAVIKRTAQNVNPMVTKKNKIMDKITELRAEYDELAVMQEQYEASIRTLTGGYTTEDLVVKVKDDNGMAKYVFKYPDTIIPVEEKIIEEMVEEEVEEGTVVENPYEQVEL